MTKARYTVLGSIPELNYVLLRDNKTNKIEAWTRSRGISLSYVLLDGHSLEYVREIKCAFRIPDTEFNRANVPDEIGRIYVDREPAYKADLVEIK